MHARSICLAPRLAEQSLQHLHLWSGGSAQLQLSTKDGWSNITSHPQLGSDKLLLRMGEALIPLFLPADVSTANIHIENTLVDSAIIFLNDQPWVTPFLWRDGEAKQTSHAWLGLMPAVGVGLLRLCSQNHQALK